MFPIAIKNSVLSSVLDFKSGSHLSSRTQHTKSPLLSSRSPIY